MIYADNADFTKHQLTRRCRGLFFSLVDGKFNVVALPFEKFFNANEHEKLFPSEYKELLEKNMEMKVCAFEKLDGQIIKLYYYEKSWHFGTNAIPFEEPPNIRKFFENKRINVDMFFALLDPDYTHIFELTAPLTHVTFYSDISLTLIGMRHNHTGKEIDIRRFGTSFHGVPVAKYEEFDSIESVMADVNDPTKSPGHPSYEGCVVFFPALNEYGAFDRLKIKAKGYFDRYIFSEGKILLAGVMDMLWTGRADPKNLSDFVEAATYIPAIQEKVLKAKSELLGDVNQLLVNLPKIKELAGKERNIYLNQFTLGHYIGVPLANIKNDEISLEDCLGVLFGNKNRDKIIKNYLS